VLPPQSPSNADAEAGSIQQQQPVATSHSPTQQQPLNSAPIQVALRHPPRKSHQGEMLRQVQPSHTCFCCGGLGGHWTHPQKLCTGASRSPPECHSDPVAPRPSGSLYDPSHSRPVGGGSSCICVAKIQTRYLPAT
jgi:hypothetical protein